MVAKALKKKKKKKTCSEMYILHKPQYYVPFYRLFRTSSRMTALLDSLIMKFKIFRSQVKSLLYKTYLHRKRSIGCTLCELLAPVVLAILLLVLPNWAGLDLNVTYKVDDQPFMNSSQPFYVQGGLDVDPFQAYNTGWGLFRQLYSSDDGNTCWCKTLAIVGDSGVAEEFKAFAETEYEAMIEYYRTVRGFNMTNQDFVPGFHANDNEKQTWVECPSANTDPFFRVFPTVAALDEYVGSTEYGFAATDRVKDSNVMDRLCGAVMFPSNALHAAKPEIHLRFNLTWNRGAVYSDFLTKMNLAADTRGLEKLIGSNSARIWYMRQGFVGVQVLVQRFLRESHALLSGSAADGSSYLDSTEEMIKWQLFPFPAYGYSSSEALEFLSNFQFVLLFCFATTVALTIGRIVSEREQKLREYLRMMGMYDISYYVAWLVALGLTWFLIALGVTSVSFVYAFNYSNFGLVLLFNYLFGLASMSFSFFISSLCTRERLGAISGAFVYFIVQAAKAPDFSPSSTFMAVSLLPPSAYVMGIRTMFFLESTAVGVTSSTLTTPVVGYSMSMCMGMLAVDIVFWWLLYYFVEQTNPFLTGYRRKWNFLFTRAYWREVAGLQTHAPHASTPGETELVAVGDKFEVVRAPALLAMEAAGECISVRSLKKKFGKSFYAVNGLDLTMYRDEIFCLLGHNGAGKTTTFSMLTGMLAPSSGSIEAFGMKIPKDMGDLRKSLGVCPQHSALWPDLTVEEHLLVFGAMRGFSFEELKPSLKSLIADVGLAGRSHFQAKALSGGMKRKLSVGIAFVGDPKIVFLDEPTSGMDPFARRSTWDLLKRKRQGRVICLTTHYMDEADVLGDRIAIMASGKLECTGTSTFLKKLYGCGYLLTFVKESAEDSLNGKIVAYLETVVGEKHVRIVSSIGKELIVEVVETDEFGHLLERLDHADIQAELGITSYGMSVTNIEEVFLQVANASHAKKHPGEKPPAAVEDKPLRSKEGTFMQQFSALLERRVRYGLRDKQMFFMQVFLPFLILLFTLGFSKAAIDQTPTPISLSVAPLNPDFPHSNIVRNGPLGAMDEAQLWSDYCARAPSTLTPDSTECDGHLRTPVGVTSYYEFQQYLLDKQDWTSPAEPFFAYTKLANLAYPWGNSPPIEMGIWHNATGLHSAPLGALGRFNAWAAPKGVDVTIVNDPFPNTVWEKQLLGSITGQVAAQMIIIAMSFVPTAIIAFIVMEKEREVRSQLAISGIRPAAYWLSHFVFDSFVTVFSTLAAIIVFWIYGLSILTSGQNLSGSFALLLLYGPASTAFAYVCSYFFSKQFTAQSFIAISSFVLGNLLVVLSYVLQLIPASGCASCASIGKGVMWGARILPAYALGSGFYRLTVFVDALKLPVTSSDLFGGCEYGVVFGNYKCYSGIGDDLFYMGIMTVVYLGIAILVDYLNSIPALRNYFVIKDDQDPDGRPGVTLEDQNVLAEKRRVEVLDKSVPMLYVNKVRKLFRRGGSGMKAFMAKIRGDKKALQDTTVYAVESVSFAADKGQVFGLLGVNGAGKTTTFKMLCGLYCPSGGEIHVMGKDATKQMDQVRKHVGYCPQFDALWDLLTPREHVLLYAKIRGYTGQELQDVVNTKLAELDLLEYTNVAAGTLSGGNKRKLSVAMALVGEPELVFLDEPSCGMDPFARRSMWNIIESVAERRKQCVIVLTTHSMEEAEALCSRIAIQVDGRFRVLGSCQEIKSMYGDGFEINVRAKESNVEKSVDEIMAEIATTETSAHVLIEAAMQLAAKDPKQAERFKHPTYGLIIPPDAAQVAVFDVANWLYRDQIFGRVVDFLTTQFTAAGFEVIELHGLTLKVKVAKLKISAIFTEFKKNKDAIRINDFQISQSPLEQIFNRFAATAVNRTE